MKPMKIDVDENGVSLECCTREARHGGSGPQHSWAVAGVLVEWLESS